jgi:hypothetical protein
VEQALAANALRRDKSCSEAVAVRSVDFVGWMKRELGPAAQHRGVEEVDGIYALRESGCAYKVSFDAGIEALRQGNTRFGAGNLLPART